MNLETLYDQNEDFRSYVDKYCKNYVEGKSITKKEAFEHLQVKIVAEYYINKQDVCSGIV